MILDEDPELAVNRDLREPRIAGLLQAFNQVGLVVKRATGSAQQPWVSTSPIDGAFYFSGNAPAQVAAADPTSTMLPPTSSPSPLPSPAARTQPDFIFPDSDSRHLSEGDLSKLSKDDLRIARHYVDTLVPEELRA